MIRHCTILIVDDDSFQRDLMAAQLAELGWTQVKSASNGQAALALYDQDPESICLIISDLRMPDMDGLVLMRHLAQRKRGVHLLLTSGAGEEILNSAAGLAHAHNLSLLGSLIKPSTTERLRALLDRLETDQRVLRQSHSKPLDVDTLQSALARGEFVPWYQPKVAYKTGKPIGVEALARWRGPDNQMISPGEFIPAIEANGLADDLFFSIVKQVAVDLKVWQSRQFRFPAAINLSMESALNLNMPEKLLRIVQLHGLQPEHFVIEVTESRLMVERSLALESLTRLSLMGFKLSIDDFGTGYSSLVQLMDLPFQELKIDGSFVRRATTESKARAVVEIATHLGTTLQMDVVAEGVETNEQVEILRKCGCQTVQGYHFARPMPFDVCSDWLTASTPSN